MSSLDYDATLDLGFTQHTGISLPTQLATPTLSEAASKIGSRIFQLGSKFENCFTVLICGIA
jgi:hypothetical protein